VADLSWGLAVQMVPLARGGFIAVLDCFYSLDRPFARESRHVVGFSGERPFPAGKTVK